MFRDGHCSQLDEHNNEVNTYLPRDKSRYNAPPDWLKTAMVPKVPSLQLAKTEVLTSYTLHLHLHFQPRIENFFAYGILRAALFSAASPAERLRSAGSLAHRRPKLKMLGVFFFFFFFLL